MSATFALLIGMALLAGGGELLVRGASKLALRMGVSGIVVGLTVVALGTSMPELVTSLVAQAHNEITIALSNVIGSNIANLALVLGAGGVVINLPVKSSTIRRDLPFLIVATLGFWLALATGEVGRFKGILLLAGLVGFIVFQVKIARDEAAIVKAQFDKEITRIHKPVRMWTPTQCIIAIVVGLGLLIYGGNMMVEAAVSLARTWGVDDRLIGLTVVALGTSLPELATTLIAIRQKEVDVAVGNVIGSNIFNMLLIGGSVALMSPAQVPASMLRFDLPVMVILTFALCAIVYYQREVGRWLGFVLLGSYAAYLVALVLQSRPSPV